MAKVGFWCGKAILWAVGNILWAGIVSGLWANRIQSRGNGALLVGNRVHFLANDGLLAANGGRLVGNDQPLVGDRHR